jgi:hypothetical protein
MAGALKEFQRSWTGHQRRIKGGSKKNELSIGCSSIKERLNN